MTHRITMGNNLHLRDQPDKDSPLVLIHTPSRKNYAASTTEDHPDSMNSKGAILLT